MAEIIKIATAVPNHCHKQTDILHFMQRAYELGETDSRKLAYLYHHSNIEQRFSVLQDFGLAQDQWQFIPSNGNDDVSLEERMQLYQHHAMPLSVKAITDCIDGCIAANEITHLITVSCTGMSAPGLDLQIAEAMQLPVNIFRTSVNFMGCYAAIHALKISKMICDSTPGANVIIVATELCTIHFQKAYSQDNAASSLLFGDGCAAVLVSNKKQATKGLSLDHFYSQVAYKGKEDMSWQLSSKGFLMSLSAYIPQLIKEDILSLVNGALQQSTTSLKDITHWCIHPGGKKILEVIAQQLQLSENALYYAEQVLARYGNMSSPTILFVLKDILESLDKQPAKIFGVAFGPGLTMETFIASKV